MDRISTNERVLNTNVRSELYFREHQRRIGRYPQENDICDVGMNVDVDIETLIQEVVVDRRADDWFLEIVESVASRYGINAPVIRSDLGEQPFW